LNCQSPGLFESPPLEAAARARARRRRSRSSAEIPERGGRVSFAPGRRNDAAQLGVKLGRRQTGAPRCKVGIAGTCRRTVGELLRGGCFHDGKLAREGKGREEILLFGRGGRGRVREWGKVRIIGIGPPLPRPSPRGKRGSRSESTTPLAGPTRTAWRWVESKLGTGGVAERRERLPLRPPKRGESAGVRWVLRRRSRRLASFASWVPVGYRG
jgi:hypothetical protein